MTEDEARQRIAADYGDAAVDRVASFLAMVVVQNAEQNLISPSTVGQIWARHAMDSAQLIPLGQAGVWLDIGTGGGFPGLLVAVLRGDPMILVEPRRKRAAFLELCADRLALTNVTVVAKKVEAVTTMAATISARAVSSVEKLLQIAAHCAKVETRWLLPRGRFSEADVAELRDHWQGMFHVEQSLTDPESSILIIDGTHRR